MEPAQQGGRAHEDIVREVSPASDNGTGDVREYVPIALVAPEKAWAFGEALRGEVVQQAGYERRRRRLRTPDRVANAHNAVSNPATGERVLFNRHIREGTTMCALRVVCSPERSGI